MDRHLAENILSALKTSTDKKFIIKGLIKLRTDLVKDKEGIELFHSIGGIACVVRFLTKPNEQIIEVVLSILANCCTISACCKEIFQLKICHTLWSILKSIDNEIIQMRAFRLMGNLAKFDSDHFLCHYNISALAKDFCNLLNESKNVPLSSMGYRACRFLLNNSKFMKVFLESGGFAVLITAMGTLVKKLDDTSGESETKDDETILTRRIEKPHQLVHREKYFEEVMLNLQGGRNDLYDAEYEQSFLMTHKKEIAGKLYTIPEDSATKELLNEILKCLKILAECKIQYSKILKNLYENIIPNIMWEGNARPEINLAPLIYLITFENRWRSLALSIVKNLSKCCYAACWLVEAKVIGAVCDLLQDNAKNLNRYDRLSCINILGNLSNDSCNRAKIRRCGAFSRLLKIMQDNTDSQTEISAIIYLLNNYQYDEISLTIMLQDGLLPLLIRELNVYISSHVDNQREHMEQHEEKLQIAKKRKIENEDIASMIKLSKLKVNMQIGCDSGGSSPINSMSPCSSRSISPEFTSAFNSGEHENDDFYSPVCSDAEDEDEIQDKDDLISNNTKPKLTSAEPLNALLGMLDVAGSTDTMQDALSDREDDLEKSDKYIENNSQDNDNNNDEIKENFRRPQILRCSDIDRIENLLLRITLLNEKRWELCREDSISTFIKAIQYFGAKNAFSASLTNILMVNKFFEHVIKHGIPCQLYQLSLKVHERDGLSFLEILSNVGESSYGQAVMIRLLDSKNSLYKNRAIITIAFVIKNPALLYTLVRTKDVLQKLLNIIFNSNVAYNTDLKREAADALTCISHNTLNIRLPVTFSKFNEEDHEIYIADEQKQLHDVCDMRFILHKDEQQQQDHIAVVEFNKQLLCESSDVFSTMLNSDFREGHEGEIHLYHYSESGICYFLNLLVRRAHGLAINVPMLQKNHVILEAFELSRIYMLPDLEIRLCDLLLRRFNAQNCLVIFNWSIKNYHHQLMDLAVNYFLSAPLTSDVKVELFQQANCSSFSQQFEHLIREALHAPLEHFNFDGHKKKFITVINSP